MRQRFHHWLNQKSETFALLTGEDFTHREVLLVHIGMLAFILLLGIAGHFDRMGM